jgi:hypothetical protein
VDSKLDNLYIVSEECDLIGIIKWFAAPFRSLSNHTLIHPLRRVIDYKSNNINRSFNSAFCVRGLLGLHTKNSSIPALSIIATKYFYEENLEIVEVDKCTNGYIIKSINNIKLIKDGHL